MVEDNPLVSIGLPVYNGEAYLETTLDSLTQQSYKNIEIVICDNASTDRTEEIVAKYKSKDNRIQYHRHEKNYGAAKNYNSTFERSSGKYFKWAAHDDALDNDYICRCVSILESDQDIVLIQPRTGQIDENGQRTAHEYVKSTDVIPQDMVGPALYRLLIQDKGSWTRIFGLIRSNILKDTPLIDTYIGSDLTLLGELSLRGKVRDIEDVLFWRREHGNTSTTGEFATRRKRWVWFDSSKNPKISMPEWRLNFEMLKSITRQRIALGSKLNCYLAVTQRMWLKKRLLAQDIYYALTDTVTIFQNKCSSKSEAS